jgi:transposase
MLLGRDIQSHPSRCFMKLYTGIDLHSSNSYVGIVDEAGKRAFKRKMPNDPGVILDTLVPFKDDVVGIVVESTYNWYWLVDLLMTEGYTVHLANPTAIQKYSGLKYSDDQHDAFWLADMLRLGILPEGYIYPKEDRPIRDLLRKRSHLVRLRTSLVLSLQNIICRNNGFKLGGSKIKASTIDHVAPFLGANEDLALAGKVSKDSIDFLTRQIKAIESNVEGKVELREPYAQLLTIQGIGKVLGLTIMLETGPIGRFDKSGNYVSYCRKVSSKWISNDKGKGKGNKKNGNKYLAWAFSEAAEKARRFHPEARAYYNRKMKKTNFMIAHAALAHKLARAAYYIMRDQVPFMPEKLFAS